MKILFLNGNLAPGADGVGDYVQRLAEACARSGHHTTLCSIADSTNTIVESAAADATPTLRLPARLPWAERVARLQELVKAFNPDWVSLQYVPYSFESRGFPWGLANRLRAALGASRIHVMYHEIWVGFWREADWKTRLWGRLQRRLLMRQHRILQPRIAHTSNLRFQTMLGAVGVPAGVLPIFSNIPRSVPTGWMTAELERLGILPSQRRQWILLGVFGSVHPQFARDDWFGELTALAARHGRQTALLGIGKTQPADRERLAAVARRAGSTVRHHHFGAQSAPMISEFLQEVDVGVATVEASLLGKSGSVAAWCDHQRPILVPRLDDETDQTSARARLHADLQAVAVGESPPPRHALGPSLDVVAHRLLATLVSAST